MHRDGNLILNGWSVSSSPFCVLKERLNTQMAPGEGQVMDMIKVGSWWDNEEWLSMKASLKVFEFKFQPHKQMCGSANKCDYD